MATGRTRFGCLLLGVALGAGAVRAQVSGPDAKFTPGQPGRAAITSADRRFLVSGMTSARNMALAGRLSESARQLEEMVGLPLPMRAGQVLSVSVQGAAAPDARLLKVQGWDDGQFYQRLVVPGPWGVDEEDVPEAVCWLLLNRYAAEETPAGQRLGAGATVPDWVAAGLAQNLQASIRSRNRDWLARELAENRALPLAQVVKQAVLPPGRWREKAYAAAAVEFLFPKDDREIWPAFFRAVGARQAIDAPWLRRNCAVLKDRRPEDAWRAHLAHTTRARHVETWSDRSLQIEEKLLQTLNFRPRDLADHIPDDVPQDVFARDLVAHRSAAWTKSVAAALSLQVQSLLLGASPALREVLAAYAAYFDQFATPPPEKRSWWPRRKLAAGKLQPPDDATWQIALNQLWVRAERAHQAFLETHQTRTRYVDSFDVPVTDAFAEPPVSDSGPARTRWQQYVDEAERRQAAP